MELLRQNPEWLLIGGLILITAFLFSRMSRRKRNAPSVLTPHEQLDRLRQVRGMRGDLEELMVEIEQMAKRMAIRLEHLLEKADRRVEELRELSRLANHSPAAVKDDAPAASEQPAPRPVVTGRGLAAMYQQAAAQQTASPAPSAEAQPEPAPVEAEPGLPDDPLARKVYTLADSGQDASQIARHLNEHVGKIELILALRHA
jgi:hypothetical protein